MSVLAKKQKPIRIRLSVIKVEVRAALSPSLLEKLDARVRLLRMKSGLKITRSQAIEMLLIKALLDL